jgi:hypothetical protein
MEGHELEVVSEFRVPGTKAKTPDLAKQRQMW